MAMPFRSSQIKFTPCVLAAIISVLCVANAKASPVTYTESATVTGSLAGTSFPANEVLTLTGTGDTTKITNPFSGSFINSVPVSFTLSVSVGGVSSGTFITDSFSVFVDQSSPAEADFGDDTITSKILGTSNNAAFASYALATSIGPITGPNTSDLGASYTTTVGALEIDTAGNGTFTAVVTPVVTPLPATLSLFATGLVGLGLLGWRRKRKALAV